MNFLSLLGIGLLWSVCHGEKAPNILVFLVDDMGWMDSSVYGSTFYETPAMERLALEGMRFTQAYAQPLCSPTRASLLTGQDAPTRFQLHQAITHNSSVNPTVPLKASPTSAACWPQSRSHLPLEALTLAEVLLEGGYQTWHLGKWHLGAEAKYGPQLQGFEVVVGAGGAGPGGGYFAPNRIPMLKPGPDGEYICDRLTNEALALLEKRDPTRPFFMYLAHFNVHSPYQAKKEMVDYFRSKADPENHHHNPVMAAMLRSMDDSLGRILDQLDLLDLVRDTVVVFLSDNGGVHWPQKAEGLDEVMPPTSNFPLRGGKCCFYEGGIRIPMMVRLPGKIEANSVNEVPVHVLDLFPTLLAYAGMEAPEGLDLDGENLKLLMEAHGSLQRKSIFGHFPRPTTLAGTVGGSWVRNGDWKLIRLWYGSADGGHAYELYDLADDPGEQRNLADENPESVKTLSLELDVWLNERGALLPRKNPDWVKSK